jgi:hypothetical protein
MWGGAVKQTKEERRYWAERRKHEIKAHHTVLPKPREEIVLLATSVTEYEQIRRDNPGMKVKLEMSEPIQTQLLDIQGLIDV